MFRNAYLRHLWATFWKKIAACNYWDLLAGLPAVALAVTLTAVTIFALQPTNLELMGQYAVRGQIAFAAKDYPTARTCFERFVVLDPTKQESLFSFARVLAATGESEPALAILRTLAPVDQDGYGPAHVLLGQWYLQSRGASPQVRQDAERHLLRALNMGQDIYNVQDLLGQLYMKNGKLEKAAEHFEAAAPAKPGLHITLLQLYNIESATDKASHEARLAANYFQDRTKANPKDYGARQNWAEAVGFLGDFPQAVSILEVGIELAEDAETVRAYCVSLAAVHAAWLRDLDGSNSALSARKMTLLQQGLQYDPRNPDLLDWVLAAAQAGSKHADKAGETLRQLLAEGRGSPMVHFILGLQALERCQEGPAQVHLDEAYRLRPDLQLIANHLAFLLSQGRLPNFWGQKQLQIFPVRAVASLADAHLASGMTQVFIFGQIASKFPDLARALRLINRVVQAYPNDSRYRETRGVVLFRMGKWEEASSDLEECLRKDGKNRSIHELLATTYAKLDKPAKAAEHRRLARELSNNPGVAARVESGN